MPCELMNFVIEPVCSYFRRFSARLTGSRKSESLFHSFSITPHNSSITPDTGWSTPLSAPRSTAFWSPQNLAWSDFPPLLPHVAPAWFSLQFQFWCGFPSVNPSFLFPLPNALCDNHCRVKWRYGVLLVNRENTLCSPEWLPTVRRRRSNVPCCNARSMDCPTRQLTNAIWCRSAHIALANQQTGKFVFFTPLRSTNASAASTFSHVPSTRHRRNCE